jgi:hypothetical protein
MSKGRLYLVAAGTVVSVAGIPAALRDSTVVDSATDLRGLPGVVGPMLPMSPSVDECPPEEAGGFAGSFGPQEAPAKVGKGRDPWIHRSSGMRCRTCIFYVEKVRERDGMTEAPLGRCRRHAPTMNGYPVVFPTDWCGDHKLDEAKA